MSSNLLNWIDTFLSLNILVIGEAMLDRYLKGSSQRLSQEAPVLVVGIEDQEDLPGGACNTAANIHSLGANACFLSVIGADEEGRSLRAALRKYGVADDHLVVQQGRKTLAKQRVLANQQMMLRLDQGSIDTIDPTAEDQLIAHLTDLAPGMDAILISDYGYGILTPRVLHALGRLQARDPRVLLVDSRKLKAYQGLRISAVKPNYAEMTELLHLDRLEPGDARIQQVLAHGRQVGELVQSQITAITLDQDGALFFERGRPPYRVYARPAEHNRVAGAGDTFMSGLALALAAGADTGTAAELASAAAAVVVEKPGTSTCSPEELKMLFSGQEKILTDTFQVSALAAAYHRQGRKVVFTNGCFDILHSGHIQYLNQAKARGDVLILGINSDASVRRLKGPNRPINPLDERIQVLAGLSSVDHLVAFDEDVPFHLVKLIEPDVYVKGGDYTRAQLPEAGLVEGMGGQVILLPITEDRSTSSIIERIRQVYAGSQET